MASVPAGAAHVTSGLIGAHDAGGAGWNGTTWSDQVTGDGYDATGTLGGGVSHTAASGPDPAYFTFTSTTADRIWFDVVPTVLGTGDFTVQMWLNVATAGQGGLHAGLLGSFNSASVPKGFGIGQISLSDGTWPGAIVGTASDGTNWTQSNNNGGNAEADVFDGNWRLLTVQRDGTTYDMWFDGVEQGMYDGWTGTTVIDMADAGVTIPLHINAGANDHASGHGRLGGTDKVNKVLVYDRHLTQAEIEQNLAAGPTEVIGGVFVVAPGDVNEDGQVGPADATIVLGNAGMASPTWTDGDVSGPTPGVPDGVIDVLDLNEVEANWGTGYPLEPPLVPEPTTLLILAGGVLAALVRRR
jgi:hypothetical protein